MIVDLLMLMTSIGLTYSEPIQSGHKNSAKNDLKKMKYSSLRKNFEEIVQTLKEEPYSPTQFFEKVQPKSMERYSRRINRQHRVVYKVNEDLKQVGIYSAWTHYE